MRGRGLDAPWVQYLFLAVLSALALGLVVAAVTRNGPDDAGRVTGATATRSPESPDAPTSPSDGGSLPTVREQRRADFTKGDGLPDGATIVDGGGNVSGLKLTARGLTHGRPSSDGLAVGLLETRFKSDVRSLGVRVRFAKQEPGAVVLAAWKTSIGAAFAAGPTVPDTGFRLVARPGAWTLSVFDGAEDILARGTFDTEPGPVTFQILRQGAQVFVVDPTGEISTVTDARVAELTGPWASWGLTEESESKAPGVIEAVWGG